MKSLFSFINKGNNNNNNNKNNDNKTMDIDKCTKEIHLKKAELFCKSCNVEVCIKCISAHPHPVQSIEDLFDDIIKDSQNYKNEIQQSISENLEKKERNSVQFQNIVQVHYEQQADKVSQYFKKVHDQLHFKEVELKRELKSYHEDNLEIYTGLTSQLENYVEESNKLMNKMSSISDQGNMVVGDINAANNETEITSNFYDNMDIKQKSVFVKYFLEQKKSNSDLEKDYLMYTFREMEDMTSRLLDALVLVKMRAIKDTVIVTYNEKGVDRYFMNKDQRLEKQDILPIDAANTPQSSGQHNTYYIYQNNSTKDRTFLFFKNKYWVLNTEAEPKWTYYTNSPITNSALSSIYDGQDHIYIFGGFDETTSTHVSNIYKFNINSMTFELVGNIPVAGCVFNLSYYDGKIYICGGHGKPQGTIDRIDEFDTNTKQVRHICKLKDLGMKHQFTSTSTFIGKTQTFYILDENRFHKYDLSTNKLTSLGDLSVHLKIPTINASHRSKFHYDGGNTLYLIVCGHQDLFYYDLKDEKWSSIPFLTSNVTYSYYYSFICDNKK